MKCWTHWRRITDIKEAKSPNNPYKRIICCWNVFFLFLPCILFRQARLWRNISFFPVTACYRCYILQKVCECSFSLCVGVSSISDSVRSRCSADLFREGQECCDIKHFSAGADPGPGSDAAGVMLITARPLSHTDWKWSGRGWSSAFCLTRIWVNMSSLAIKGSNLWFKEIMCREDDWWPEAYLETRIWPVNIL